MMGTVKIIPAKKIIGSTDLAAKTRLKVAAYCRVSTDREEQESSYDVQVAHYQEYISSRQDWELAGIYADDGISATNTKKREQFNKMIDDCMSGRIDMVLTKSISRFARNTVDCLKIIRQLKEKRIPVMFEKENINTLDAKGEVLLTIMASLAQQESESLSKNITMGLQFRYQQGYVMVNHNRFLGYTRQEKNGVLVVVPEEAEIVRRIYREFLEGKSLLRIARALTHEGVRNGAGNTKWWESNVQQILTNEKYMGDALLQKTYTADILDKVRKKNLGEMPQYYVEGSQEAIVSKKMFAMVQQEMARRSALMHNPNGRKRVYSSRYALSGIVFCGECGELYRRITWYIKGKRSIVWRCEARLERRGNGCNARTVHEEELFSAVVVAIDKVFQLKDDFFDAFEENIKVSLDKPSDCNRESRVKQIDSELEELQAQVVKLALARKDFTDLAARIQQLREERQVLLDNESMNNETKKRLDDIKHYLRNQAENLKEYDDSLTRNFVARITVLNKGFRVLLRNNMEIDVP